jgi:hypothetical protein
LGASVGHLTPVLLRSRRSSVSVSTSFRKLWQ